MFVNAGPDPQSIFFTPLCLSPLQGGKRKGGIVLNYRSSLRAPTRNPFSTVFQVPDQRCAGSTSEATWNVKFKLDSGSRSLRSLARNDGRRDILSGPRQTNTIKLTGVRVKNAHTSQRGCSAAGFVVKIFAGSNKKNETLLLFLIQNIGGTVLARLRNLQGN